MFTNDDTAFLDRLGQRADFALSSADPCSQRLRVAIAMLRAALDLHAVDPQRRGELDGLLDAIAWSSDAGDRDLARRHAAALARAVRGLDLQGMRAMRMVDAAQQIRTLVVLAA